MATLPQQPNCASGGKRRDDVHMTRPFPVIILMAAPGAWSACSSGSRDQEQRARNVSLVFLGALVRGDSATMRSLTASDTVAARFVAIDSVHAREMGFALGLPLGDGRQVMRGDTLLMSRAGGSDSACAPRGAGARYLEAELVHRASRWRIADFRVRESAC